MLKNTEFNKLEIKYILFNLNITSIHLYRLFSFIPETLSEPLEVKFFLWENSNRPTLLSLWATMAIDCQSLSSSILPLACIFKFSHLLKEIHTFTIPLLCLYDSYFWGLHFLCLLLLCVLGPLFFLIETLHPDTMNRLISLFF